jgi:putative ABC transport system ATP-binding protein
VVSGILSSFDGVVKRMGHIYYFLTALTELSFLFSLPKDQDTATLSIPLPDPTVNGIRVTCKDLTFAPAGGPARLRALQPGSHARRKNRHLCGQHNG